MPKEDMSGASVLFSQPFQQGGHVHLIGLVIAGHSIDHDIDPEADGHFSLSLAAWNNRSDWFAPLVARPGRGPVIAPHDDGGDAIAAARRDLAALWRAIGVLGR